MLPKYDPKKAEGGFKLIPEGTYECFISATSLKRSSSGNEMIEVNYKIREDVEGQEEYGGQEIKFDRIVFSPNTEWHYHRMFGAVGFDPNVEFSSIQEFAQALKGRAVLVDVVHEEATQGKHKGKMFPRVQDLRISAIGGKMTDAPKKEDNPFADSGEPVELSDDDLPF